MTKVHLLSSARDNFKLAHRNMKEKVVDKFQTNHPKIIEQINKAVSLGHYSVEIIKKDTEYKVTKLQDSIEAALELLGYEVHKKYVGQDGNTSLCKLTIHWDTIKKGK